MGSLKVSVICFGAAGSVALAAGSDESSSLWADALAGSSRPAKSSANSRAPARDGDLPRTIGVSLARSYVSDGEYTKAGRWGPPS